MLGLAIAGCGGGSTPVAGGVTVFISPTTVTVVVGTTLQFQFSVTGATDQTVKWKVNDVEGGNDTVGKISTSGLYTAPAKVPSPATVTVKAVANANSSATASATVTVDSGVKVTVSPTRAVVGTGEKFPFSATVTGPPGFTSTGVTWSVNGTGGANGSVSPTGEYTAPTSLPNPATATVTATSKDDTTRSASATVALATAGAPTLTSINPSSAAQGSLFQDVYLIGTNFFSTSAFLLNNTALPFNAVTSISTTLFRVRLPDSQLANPGTLAIQVKAQDGTTSAAQNLTVLPVRPALVGTSPDSAIQDSAGATTYKVNGGYFGTPGQPVPTVKAKYDDATRAAEVKNARQLTVTISGADLANPGLISVGVLNTGVKQPPAAPQQVAITNFAVLPADSSIPLATPPKLTVGTKPGAIAINTATGIAVVANKGSNNVTLIDISGAAPVVLGKVAVGTSPTGVAVDNVLNLALVANNGSDDISVVNLATRTVTATVSLANFRVAGTGPFSIGINPLKGLAYVAYAPTSSATRGTINGTLLDLNKLATQPVVGIVSTSTGQTPQVAVEPKLNWAVVTPGGAGTLSIVDLSGQNSQNLNTIAPASGTPQGASCAAAGIVTVTTTKNHGLVADLDQGATAVLIQGVSPAGFNGVYTVTSVPSPTSFTYTLPTGSCPTPSTGGNGTAQYSRPLFQGTAGAGVTGVGLNSETEKALLVDPSSSQVSFFSVLDQTITSLTLETGTTAAAFNPLNNVAVAVNPVPNPGTASILDPGEASGANTRPPRRIATVPVGAGPKAVAIDPGSNTALIANETDGTVSILSLGPLRPLHITQMILPADRQLNPTATLTSTDPLTITLFGKGFLPGSQVRLDGVALPAPTNVTDRSMNVTIPASFLSVARRYALDVLNPGGVHSNMTDLTVVQPVAVPTTGCTAPTLPAPRAVAIDAERNLAVVTDNNCNTVSLIDLTSGTVVKTLAVGKNPQGVALISRLGKAVVTNHGDNNASLVDLVAQSVGATPVIVGTGPIGVAINQDTAVAVVANVDSNTISLFPTDATGTVTATSVSVEARPVAVALDSSRNFAVVACAQQNTFNVVDLSQATPTVTSRFGPQLPTSVAFDPVTGVFVGTSSLGNLLFILTPDSQQTQALKIGINPSAIAYNFQSGTLVTVNLASNTLSVLDFLDRRVRAILPLSILPTLQTDVRPQAIDIHPRTNLAVVADEANSRVLLLPLPR